MFFFFAPREILLSILYLIGWLSASLFVPIWILFAVKLLIVPKNFLHHQKLPLKKNIYPPQLFTFSFQNWNGKWRVYISPPHPFSLPPYIKSSWANERDLEIQFMRMIWPQANYWTCRLNPWPSTWPLLHNYMPLERFLSH